MEPKSNEFTPDQGSDSGGPRNPNRNPVIVSFEPDDPSNPHNWSECKKAYIVFTGTLMSINSTMGSAITANMMPYVQSFFSVPPGPQTVLPASIFLVGFILGPLFCAPLSEQYGRKPVLLVGISMYVLCTLASGLSRNWTCFLVFRFLSGVFGAPPMSVTGGAIADVYENTFQRGRMNMLWAVATVIGPLAAPVVSGFAGPHGWQIAFWVAVGFGSLNWIACIVQPETLASKILRNKAARMNRLTVNEPIKYVCAADVENGSVWKTLTTTISRPVHLLFHEMIVFLTCIYMAFVYAVFYMLLEIFPAIFHDLYGFSYGLTGVAFLMMGIGSFLSIPVGLLYERISPQLVSKYPQKHAEFLRLPLACIGGPAFAIGLFWLGWASKLSVPWIVPLLAMIPYGFAYQIIFMSMINYIADAYGTFAASALAACGCTRSIVGALIPLSVDHMLARLGISWSCTVLGLISALLSLVPFGFIFWGERIRAGSKFSTKLEQVEESGLNYDLSLARSLSAV